MNIAIYVGSEAWSTDDRPGTCCSKGVGLRDAVFSALGVGMSGSKSAIGQQDPDHGLRVDAIGVGAAGAARNLDARGVEYEAGDAVLVEIPVQPRAIVSGLEAGHSLRRLVVVVGQPKALAIAVKGSHERRRWSKLADWLAVSEA